MRSPGPCLPLVIGALLPAQQAPSASERARALVERFMVPAEARAAAREFTTLGADALPTVHRALHDRRPPVVQWTLYAAASLRCDLASLRDPIRALADSKNLGIALAARQAWPAIDGKGRVLVADYHANQVLLCDHEECVPVVADLVSPMSALPLLHGGYLITVYGGDCIVELDANGAELWAFARLQDPSDAERLPGGNTLIADSANQRVVEVDPTGEVVWTHEADIRPIDADRLANGNTLISNYQAGGVLEVDRTGAIVWQFPGDNIRDADRLLDDTTLVTMADQQRVVLVDMAKRERREWKLDFTPNDSELLADGHLVAAGDGAVVEFDAQGRELWRRKIGYAGRVLRLGARPTPAPR